MRRLVLASAILAAACGGDDGVDELTLLTPAQCNPLGGTRCITPFPAGLYEIADDTTATGRRLDLPAGALPTSIDNYPIDPAPFNERDGFSAAAHIFTAFPGGVDPGSLVHYTDYGASLTDASPTVLVDMSSGERVVHFAEVDARAADQPDHQALYVRPATRLRGGTRYAVGIRRSLKARGGGELAEPEGFAALRDGTVTSHALLERYRPRFAEVLAALEAAGVPRDDLVVAWDFTTTSDASVTGDLLAARDLALPAMGPAGANLDFAVDSDTGHDDPAIARVIHGSFDAPLFLTQDGAYAPGTELARDGAGAPMLMGLYRAPFTAIVPACAEAERPVGVMLYGHGLLGKASDQVTSGAIRATAAALCVVVVGTDWRGMSQGDLPAVARALNDLNRADEIFDVLVQGIINFIALEHAARGPLAAELFVDGDGASLVDPERIYFYGLSQGHIFGSTFMAFDPFITRGVVGVGGANYSLMLERSVDWPTYRTILIGAYPDPLDVVILIHLMQLHWDRTDPVGSATTFADGLPGTPAKQMLLHMSVGDAEVPNVSTEYQARTMGLPVLAPAVYAPYGVPEQAEPGGSALVIFDGGFETDPSNITAEDNDAHQLTRRQGAALRQMKTFFETGEIVHTCGDGQVCDCTIGACD